MTQITVIGAKNFVGRCITHALLDAGHGVQSAADLPQASLDPMDVRGDHGVASHAYDLQGVDVVVHMGGSFGRLEGGAFDAVRATQDAVNAARAAGIKRFIHVGCISAGAGTRSHYLHQQWKAESIVRGAGADLPFTILRPSVVVGRGDGVTDGLAAWMKIWPLIPIPGRGQERVQPVDVQDLARCVVGALDEQFVNEMISVGGPSFLTYRQLVDLVGSIHGHVRPKLLLSSRILRFMNPVIPAAARSLVEPHCLDLFEYGGVASPGIIQRNFGFEPRPVHALLAEYLP